MSNFRLLEVVDRGSETQLQVGDNFIIQNRSDRLVIVDVVYYLRYSPLGECNIRHVH